MDLTSYKEKISRIQKFKKRCETIINFVRGRLENYGGKDTIVEVWRKDLEKIKQMLEFPRTIIAVVGDTGVGKSSLINALLNQYAILPTSGFGNSCTSVVVEISGNLENDMYEADIEYLSQEDWESEVRDLLEDINAAGISRSQSEEQIEEKLKLEKDAQSILASYQKIKSVYGGIKWLDISTGKPTGKKFKTVHKCFKRGTDCVEERDVEKFKTKLIKYIQSHTADDGESSKFQYWPIVKRVKVRIPNCDVCRSGAVLVDLPGVGDSNLAKNKISKEYMGNCNSLWIVKNIQRAIDNKTADDFLDRETLKDQYMDGKYGNIVFVCTKTDEVIVDEIERSMKQRKTVPPEYEKVKEDIKRIEKQEKAQVGELELSRLKNKKVELKKKKRQICALVRNEYCSKEMKNKFRKVMEQNIVGEDVDSDDTNGNDKSEEKTNVFCCSSFDYMVLKQLMPDEDQPKVFLTENATEIPKLQEFIHKITLKRHLKLLQNSLKHLLHCLNGSVLYLAKKENEVFGDNFEQTIKVQFSKFKHGKLERENFKRRIENDVIRPIKRQLDEGVKRCEERAITTSRKWGLKYEGNSSGGLHHRTYIAVVRRHGEYIPPGKGTGVNFNSDLAQPLFEKSMGSLIKLWKDSFSDKLPQAIESLEEASSTRWNKKLKRIFEGTQMDKNTKGRFEEHFCDEASLRLSEMADEMKMCAKNCQEKDKYAFVESIQHDLKDEYDWCKEVKGKGTLEKIKNRMENGIQEKKDKLFKDASDKVKNRLDLLQKELEAEAKSSLGSLVNENMSNAILTTVQTTPSEELSSLCSDFRKQLKKAKEIDQDVKEFTKTVPSKYVSSVAPQQTTSHQQCANEEDKHSPAKKAKKALM